MKGLILATVSALTLGVGGIGAAYAQGYSGTAMGPNNNYGNAANTGEAYAFVTPGQVAQAQQELTRAGDYNGPINGVLDPMTSDALLRYQEQRGLPDTGGFNPPTMASLGLSTAPPYTYERTGYGYAAVPAIGARRASAMAAAVRIRRSRSRIRPWQRKLWLRSGSARIITIRLHGYPQPAPDAWLDR